MRERRLVSATQGAVLPHTPASSTRSPRYRWVLAAFLAATLAGCGGGGSGNETGNSGGTTDVPTAGGGDTGGDTGGGDTGGGVVQDTTPQAQAAFRDTVFPIVAENCAVCHSESISSIKPDFAHSNFLVAYDEIVNNQKVNLANPANSRVVVRLRREGHNCWGGVAECEANAAEMQAAVTQWASMVADIAPLPTVISGKTTFAEGAVVNEQTVLSFDVSAIAGAPAAIEVEASEFDDHSYLFINPACVGAGCEGLAVKDVRVAVNDLIAVAAQSFKTVDAVATDGAMLSGNGSVIPQDLGVGEDVFHLAFAQLGGQAAAFPEPGPRVIDDGLPPTEPDHGVRTFSQINDNMSAITGVGITTAAVANRYNDIRESLPATPSMNAFSNAQQLVIQGLAIEYCGVVVDNNGLCNNLFSVCNANNVANVSGSVYDNIIGAGLVNQPDRVDFVNALVAMANSVNVVNQADDLKLQSICAAAVASAAQTIN